MTRHRAIALFVPLLVLPLAAPVAQQGRVLDAGTLLVKVDSRLVAREEFVLRSGRGSGATTGFTLTTTIVYPPEYPQRRFTAVIEYEPDSQPAAARFEVESSRTVLYRLGGRRMTVRIGTDQSESAREYPGGGSYVALDDSVFGYHALMGAYRPGSAHTFSSRGDRGYQIQIEDRGIEATSIGGVSDRLHHIRLTGGPVDRHLWFDTQGRLVQVTIPDRRMTIVRESEPSGSQ